MAGITYPIYLDSHATTPVDPRVFEEMEPYFTEKFGNASSLDHSFGYDASIAVQQSREKIAKAFGADMDEIIFTSGATESDNLALVGVMNRNRKKGSHLITSQIEHKAILDTARYLENAGFKVTYLPVNEFGQVCPKDVESAITDETVLISIMYANNEIGTIQDIADIGRIAHSHDVLFHTDAAQAVGHIQIDVDELNIDLMSFSSHKIYGPKGIGALYVRSVMPRVKISPTMFGGGQERGLRSGTLNVPSVVGFAKAIEIAQKEMKDENNKFKKWTDYMLQELVKVNGRLNGHPTKRLPHNLNVRFDGIESKAIINSISKKIAISAGSACTTQTVEPSHVLLGLGLSETQTHSSIRIGCGRFNTDQEIKIAADEIRTCVDKLGRISSEREKFVM